MFYFQIAELYGDADMSNIVVLRIAKGSVVFSWHNKTIQTDDGVCPQAEIDHLVSYMINSDKTLNSTFVKKMLPYVVTMAGSRPLGNCDGHGVLPQPETTPEKPVVDEIGPIPHRSESDLLITFIVPAIVIACMLLLACIIACCLYRRKRKGSLSREDQHTFINRGIPIIFADELEDKPEAPTKPLILKDEKPPLPPHYPQSLDSLPSSPDSYKKDGFCSTDDDMMSPLYRPPPPLTGSHDRKRERNKATFRQPPPYIPP